MMVQCLGTVTINYFTWLILIWFHLILFCLRVLVTCVFTCQRCTYTNQVALNGDLIVRTMQVNLGALNTTNSENTKRGCGYERGLDNKRV